MKKTKKYFLAVVAATSMTLASTGVGFGMQDGDGEATSGVDARPVEVVQKQSQSRLYSILSSKYVWGVMATIFAVGYLRNKISSGKEPTYE